MKPLERLAPDLRAVVSLVLQQGRSYEEIAALLGMPIGSIGPTRGRALERLRRELARSEVLIDLVAC